MNLLNKVHANTAIAGLLITLFSLCLSSQAFADLFGSDEDVLWKSGNNLYIKLVEQDKSGSGKTPPNDHPVTLNSRQVADALSQITVWEKKVFSDDADAESVFAISQARFLGNFISQGLAKAAPGQDLVFVLASQKQLALGFKDRVYVAGRVFYHDERLHVIIGDHDRPADKGLEAVYDAQGDVEVVYNFTIGKRAQPSGFKGNIITGNGIEVYLQENKRRRDWIVIDVPAAAAAFIAKTEKKDKPAAGADSEAIREEAARIAHERRQMRAEMARMRKEMNEVMENKEQLTIEERLARLDELHKKNLISDSEYDQKRKEILDDI